MDDNFLARLTSLFRRESVPMAPQPSIVKAGEDEDIYVDNGVPANVPPRIAPTHNILGIDIYAPSIDEIKRRTPVPMPGLEAPQAPMVEAPGQPMMVPNPDENVDEMGMPVPHTTVPSDQPTEVPPIPEEGVPVPDEMQNLENSLKFAQDWQSTVPEGSPAWKAAQTQIEETQAEIDALVESGKPRSGGRNNARTGPPPVGNLSSASRPLSDIMPDGDSISTPTLEEATVIADDIRENVPKLYSPPTEEGGSPTPPTVRDPSGKTRTVTQRDVEDVATKDPLFGKAMNWIQKTFGITGQDLARFALLYVGSRIAGYDHQGSMSWSFEVAGTEFLDRRKMAVTLADSGKYTPESIEKYRITGDTSALKRVPEAGKGIKFDYTKTRYKQGTDELLYQATMPNGSVAWVEAGTGKTYVGPVEDIGTTDSDNKYRADRINHKVKVITDIIDRQDEKNPWYLGSPTADANIVQERIDAWSKRPGVGVKLDSGATDAVMRNAVLQAERWAAATGNPVYDLGSFVDAQLMYMGNEYPWAQQLHKNGRQLNPDELNGLVDNIIKFSMVIPEFDPSKVEQGALLHTFMEMAYEKYTALPEEEKKKYTKSDGFYTFLITQFGTSKEK